MLSAIEVLEQARDIFQHHGGAQGIIQDERGRVCAVGAIAELSSRSNHWNNIAAINARFVLDRSARTLFADALEHFIGIIEVNDELGSQAVLDVYDHAIKTLSGK